MSDCIFCDISLEKIPAYVVWEDARHIAFLSIFPNTEGVTVVITKEHFASYVFDLPESVMINLVIAAKSVAKLLDTKLNDVGRTAMVFEGFGVDHAHAKLYPLHGTKTEKWSPIHSDQNVYFDTYKGYISTHDFKGVSAEDLARVKKKIRE